jgi:dipeptidyl aminopeptidase/acylaminoacyl peptidase
MQFDDLGDYVAIPALTALQLSPDGSWLAAAVQTLSPDPKKFVTSLWRIDTSGHAAPVRLTRSATGEGGHRFLPDGSLLFISRRPEPDPAPGDGAETDKPGLWLLPAGGGEASRVAAPPGGVAGLATARDARGCALTAPVFAGATDADADAKRRKARQDAGVSAILHSSGLVRYWDHDLGPDCLRLQALAVTRAEGAPGSSRRPAPAGPAAEGGSGGTPDAGAAGQPRDLTTDPGRALDEHSFDLAGDGSVVVTGWSVQEPGGQQRSEIVVIDVATTARRTLLADTGADFDSPRISPDGRLVAAIRAEHDRYERPGEVTLVVAALDGSDAGPPRDLLAGLDRRPVEVAWAPDSGSVFVVADDHGRRPVFRADLATGQITRVTTDDGAYDNLCPSPDGRALYALRSAIDSPPAPVRIDLAAAAADPETLPSPAGPVEVPGRLEEVQAAAADGTVIRSWLVLPHNASPDAPAPLLLWVHGGPVSSWNAWSWRWNPWLMAARGYAVLLPDPALSTGYGQGFIARGHGTWGGKPFTDVMTVTDAVVARPDIDERRTAMMGGSFGGYMANWIAGHTGRFAAIVSHAGLWALDQMFATTDGPPFWRREFGDPALRPERYRDNSPHLHADSIVTPMLIIHGDKDYRVPVGEALRLYWDLLSRDKKPRFLYFPDENHWILKPGDVRVWYETIFAFLAEHVLGEQWRQPELL